MFRLLIVIKIVICYLVFVKSFQATSLGIPPIALALVMLVCDFWRSASGYRSLKLNIITFLFNIILAVLFSWTFDRGSFDKLCLLYMIEEIAVLPKPYALALAPLTLLANTASSVLFDMSRGGPVEIPGFAEMLLYVLVIVLVLSERAQREQRLAYERQTKELSYINQRLRESLAWNEELASQAERRRLAAEIHDSLGHDLTGLILTLEAGKKYEK
ncbi:MAG: histidine kinase [Peptococcaceae bacterium]|nr:histidine kinase [Peptococcaceae bacterium]